MRRRRGVEVETFVHISAASAFPLPPQLSTEAGKGFTGEQEIQQEGQDKKVSFKRLRVGTRPAAAAWPYRQMGCIRRPVVVVRRKPKSIRMAHTNRTTTIAHL